MRDFFYRFRSDIKSATGLIIISILMIGCKNSNLNEQDFRDLLLEPVEGISQPVIYRWSGDEDELTLNWYRVDGAVYYNLYSSTNISSEFEAAEIHITGTEIILERLSKTKYYFYLVAYGKFGQTSRGSNFEVDLGS